MKKNSNLAVLLKGILVENPVFILVLGTCPTLATTTKVTSALGMGLATMVVLICSNLMISLLRKIIPDSVRIPCYIVIIAGFVSVVEMLIRAFIPGLYEALGVYIALITVNCIILGRAEMFANKNTPLRSVFDGVGMGVGFTLALFSISLIREVLGSGTFAGLSVPFFATYHVSVLSQAPGGMLVFGSMIALVHFLTKGKAPRSTEFSCAGCPSAGLCHTGTCKNAQTAAPTESESVTAEGK